MSSESTLLHKLDALLEARGISKHRLSEESGVPYTTILGFYDEKKGYQNMKLSTLKALAKYFGVTLDYFASDGVAIDVSGDDDNAELMKMVKNASPEQKRMIYKMLKEE